MGKLLRADFFRAFRNKIFYALLAVNALVGVMAVVNEVSWRAYNSSVNAFGVLSNGFGGGFAFIGILNAVLVSIFVGHEYSCGAMRNKVMTGGGRSKIYLSKLTVCSAMCAAVYCVYHIVNFILGSAVLGWGEYSAAQILLAFLAGLFMSLAYCAIFTGISMLSKNTVVGLLAGIIGTLVMLFVIMWLQSNLEGSYIPDPEDPDGALFVACGWPALVQGLVRWLIRLVPTGQSMLLTMGTVTELGVYAVLIALSCFWIALSAVVGSLFFRKTDMK